MKIGLVVYSGTGHTWRVAERLKEVLSTAGHSVALERLASVEPVSAIEAEGPSPVSGYEALVFGAPVHGGLPAPPMAQYLEHIDSLEGKRVACLVTGLFPPGLGRNQALAQMEAVCESKGATLCGSGSVGWLSLRRKRQIASTVESLAALF